MATNMTDLKRRRRQPNARTIKKHSDIVRRSSGGLVVGGARERTPTGLVVPGYVGKTFETYYETMLAGTSTASVLHAKKDRTIRIITGTLFVLSQKGDAPNVQQLAHPGDELVFERGTTYRLATSKEDCEFFVCQSAKYAATLEVVDATSLTSKEVDDFLLQEPTQTQRISQAKPRDGQTRRKGSKAKEQLMAAKAGRNSAQIAELPPSAPIPGRAGAIESGVSPSPSRGRFSDEGAG